MARTLKPAVPKDEVLVEEAIAHLKHARRLLAQTGCGKAADKVRVALRSADGARRHVGRRIWATQPKVNGVRS